MLRVLKSELLARPRGGLMYVCPLLLSLSSWIYWHTDQGNSWSAFPAQVVGELPCGSQQTAPTCVVSLKGVLALAPAIKGLSYTGIFPDHWPDSYVMLLSLNKSETAVHRCHCPGDMAVHMREVLARPRVVVCVPLALRLSYATIDQYSIFRSCYIPWGGSVFR